MSFASAQLYLRDIQIIRDLPVCGNRSDVNNWNVRQQRKTWKINFKSCSNRFRLMFIFYSFHFISFHWLSWLFHTWSLSSSFGKKVHYLKVKLREMFNVTKNQKFDDYSHRNNKQLSSTVNFHCCSFVANEFSYWRWTIHRVEYSKCSFVGRYSTSKNQNSQNDVSHCHW